MKIKKPLRVTPHPDLPKSGEGEESHPQVGEGTTVSSSIRGMSILSSIEFTFLNQKSNFSKYIVFIYT